MSPDTPSAPEDRFCDLVMKGGITSGIVYPPAIADLAKHYRFRSIGGTSAGAIAAVVTAAAEYRRRQTGRMDGFEMLDSLPDRLCKQDDDGRTQLLRLFQPDKPCRRLFAVLVASLNRSGTRSRVAAIALGLLRAYWPATLLAFAVSALVGATPFVPGEPDLVAGASLLVLTLALFVGCWVYYDFTRNVVRNAYGLCKGLTTENALGPALTPWLHALIQSAAGLPQAGRPLTFGDLWRAEGFPPKADQRSGDGQTPVRSIDLQMFTTNLAHGRPYLLPHEEPTARLFYRSEDLRQYLPEDVMRWFDEHAREYAPNADSPSSDPPKSEAKRLGLKEIPAAEDFPVLLAARMSLSFPVLFAALPLYAIDYERPRANPRTFKPCYFSDGGLSSNFPIHLFDALLPNWPTFGIQLEPKLPERDNLIFLPKDYHEGFADRWTRFAEEERPPTRMAGFLASLFNATQNWNDNTLSRMPGVRDRVVRVRLNEDEGGINLNMLPDTIMAVAERGHEAAQALVDRFVGKSSASATTPVAAAAVGATAAPATAISSGASAFVCGTAPATQGWDQQRWVRLDVLIHALSCRAPGVISALSRYVAEATSYADLLVEAQQSAPPGHSAPLTSSQAQALQNLVAALEALASAFAQHSKHYPNSPVPEAVLRVRPPL